MSKLRDCSICLEVLIDADDCAAAATHVIPLTFTIPCGHVFHTRCYHTWNKAQLYKRRLQCATCQTPLEKSYYLCSNVPCKDCGQPLYEDDIVFDKETKILHHAKCGSSRPKPSVRTFLADIGLIPIYLASSVAEANSK